MAAKSIERTEKIETPKAAWLIGLAAWAVPGLGHVLQGRWMRGLLLGGAVWAMFLTGLLLGGHLFTVTDHGPGIPRERLPQELGREERAVARPHCQRGVARG